MVGFRVGLVADCGAVFAVAARTRVAIELDGDPARQDLDYTLARQALDAMMPDLSARYGLMISLIRSR